MLRAVEGEDTSDAVRVLALDHGLAGHPVMGVGDVKITHEGHSLSCSSQDMVSEKYVLRCRVKQKRANQRRDALLINLGSPDVTRAPAKINVMYRFLVRFERPVKNQRVTRTPSPEPHVFDFWDGKKLPRKGFDIRIACKARHANSRPS